MILWRKIEIIIFYHFESDPRFPPFLLYVRWKSGVTFVRRCFRNVRFRGPDFGSPRAHHGNISVQKLPPDLHLTYSNNRGKSGVRIKNDVFRYFSFKSHVLGVN